jgi:FkbM family methyltransferase
MKSNIINFNKFLITKKFIKNLSPIIFDVGSNCGQSIKEIVNCYKKAQVHCFEPLPEMHKLLLKLKRKYKNNRIFLNITACGSKNQKKIFYLNQIAPSKSSFFKINTKSKLRIKMKKDAQKKIFRKKINNKILVNQIKLDDYIKKNKIKKIDIIKIDTEGYEINVLKGLKNNLKNIKILILEMRFDDHFKIQNSDKTTFFKVEKIIKKYFTFLALDNIYINPFYKSIDFMDAIYINKKTLSPVI